MYALLLDETNKERTETSRFFLYGGVFFHLDTASALHREMKTIRERAGFKETDLFKFQTHSRPKSVSKDKFNQAKEKVLSLCEKHKVLFIAYMVSHNVAYSQSLQKKIEWASKEIIYQFNEYLARHKEKGIVIFDNLPFKGGVKYLRELFCKGITTATTRNNPQIPKNIVGYSISTIGASHLNSIMDIILGSFRYCVNANRINNIVKKLLPKVRNLMYGIEDRNGNKYVREFGLLLRPHLNLFYEDEDKEILSRLGVII